MENSFHFSNSMGIVIGKSLPWNILTTSAIFKFSSISALRWSGASRSVEKLYSGKTGWISSRPQIILEIIKASKLMCENTSVYLRRNLVHQPVTSVLVGGGGFSFCWQVVYPLGSLAPQVCFWSFFTKNYPNGRS